MVFDPPNLGARLKPQEPDANDYYWATYKRALLRADYIISLCRTLVPWFARWLKTYPEEQILPVRPGINSAVIRNTPDADERDTVTFVGRLCNFKYPQELFEVAQELEPKPKRVVIIGGEERSVPPHFWRPGQGPKGFEIVWHPNCPDKKKFEELKRSKLLIMPSRFEGFGIPPAEALACGTPTVAYPLPTFTGEYGDCIDYADVPVGSDGVPELRDDVSSARALVKAAQRLWNDENYWMERSAYGVKAAEKFSFEAMCANVRQAFPLGQFAVGGIAYREAEYLRQWILTHTCTADLVVVVEGRVEGFPELPEDGTEEILEWAAGLPNVRVIREELWPSKLAMQNAYLRVVEKELGEAVLYHPDIDEFIDPRLAKMVGLRLKRGEFVGVKWYHAWPKAAEGDAPDTMEAVAERFGRAPCHLTGARWDAITARIHRFEPYMRFKKGFDQLYDEADKITGRCIGILPGLHLGYLKPISKVRAKTAYYRRRGDGDREDVWKERWPAKPAGPGAVRPMERFVTETEGILRGKAYGPERIALDDFCDITKKDAQRASGTATARTPIAAVQG